jgi:transcriptional regulator with XRE-family HTH domain
MTEGYRLEPPYPVENLGEGLRKAREFRGLSVKISSQLAGIPTSKLQNYENGKFIPSLPEVESFSFIYRIPLKAIFYPEDSPDFFKVPNKENLQQLITIRQQIISTKLKIAFDQSKMGLKGFSNKCGISLSKIKRYLGGETTIPLDDLQKLSEVLGINVNGFLDTQSPAGVWQEIQRKKNTYSQLPSHVQDFINQPTNWPFMETAGVIKEIDTEKLKTVADSLLKLVDIRSANQERADNTGN